MNALTRAELLKLSSTRLPVSFLVGTLAMVLVTVGAVVPTSATANAITPLDDPALLTRVVGSAFLWPQLTIALLGVLAYTQEVRHGTITSTFLVEPRRYRVLEGKAVALILASVVITVATIVVSVLASVALITVQDGNVAFGSEFWQVLAAGFLVLALSGLMGLAVGALLENQIVAVTITLVWLTAGEHLLIQVLPQIARWTPGGTTAGLLQLGAEATTSGTLLQAPISGLLLVGYTVAAAVIALAVAPRRDIL
jgi:ABC-type transport system involved in multi-copper enzyme maturation permease subunit